MPNKENFHLCPFEDTPTLCLSSLQKAPPAPQPLPVSSLPDAGAESFSDQEEGDDEEEDEEEEDGREGIVLYDFTRESTHNHRLTFEPK